MTFVVVYLIRARQYAIVPDEWVYDLNTAKLKNNGRNSNQDYMVFCSFTNWKPNLTKKPNFDAKLEEAFDGSVNEARYLCRIEKFFGK